MRFSFFLLEDLCATFAKVRKVDQTNGLRLQQVFCRRSLAGEGPAGRGIILLICWRHYKGGFMAQ